MFMILSNFKEPYFLPISEQKFIVSGEIPLIRYSNAIIL